jgi:hypothetical protein
MVTLANLRKRFARLNRCSESDVRLEGLSDMKTADAKKFVDSAERFYDEMHKAIYRGYRNGERVRLSVGNRITLYVPGTR